jgi:hypothetical protein
MKRREIEALLSGCSPEGDQSIALDGFYTGKGYPEHLRRIRFCDPDTNKRLVFLTNNFAIPQKQSPRSTKSDGKWSCSSNGSNNT